MRLVTFRTEFGTRAGRLEGEEITPLDAPDVGTLLAESQGEGGRRAPSGGRGSNQDWQARAIGASEPPRHLEEVRLAPVVPRPGKIICVGHNYQAHIAEMGADMPEHPTLFAKFASSLIGARDDIVLPRVTEALDWEVELAVIVGRPVRYAEADEAREAIAGFTVCNDVSARDWQRRTKQWLAGKTFDATTPVGPALVTPDEVDWARDLEVRCEVDGRVMQQSRTSDLLFSPATLVSYASQIMTLEPGDLIATGTPSGVGAGRTPPEFLAPGQVLRTVIEGLGECANPVVKEDGA
ncbi:MAG: 2-hydroxyhepta-2,4-diene-1,7-dioate isomerase [Nitriliruptorales bacterium]|nr:2-hydroxyhepta-2,4-diene-1,7-dioate isomerase [Nitriliruptorales bacterium]